MDEGTYIPPPRKGNPPRGVIKWAKEASVGDVYDAGEHTREKAMGISSRLYQYKRRNPGVDFVTRKMDDGTIKVWRLK